MTRLGEIKRDRPCNRRRLLWRGTLALPFILALKPARAVERVGSVEEITGEAFAELESVRRTLDRAAPVFFGEEVVTGVASRLGMRLGRNTTVRLGEQARLKIDRFTVDAGGEMTLSSGPMLFDGEPLRAGLQIRSPFALIAVRGTRFFAGPSNDRFGVFVARGSVTVTSAGQHVILRQGEGTDIASPGTPPTLASPDTPSTRGEDIASPGTPPTPVKRWAPERIRAALASVS
jgi:ferric-dicitrate binding protein FerR (iron transport regulator)